MTGSSRSTVPGPRFLRWLGLVVLSWLLAIPMVVTVSSTACACSCVAMSVPEQVDRADLVAVGEVRRVTKRSEPWQYVSRHLELEVALTRVHKGPSDSLVTVRTYDQSASCGIEPEVGQEILLFARADDGAWGTNICDGTGALTDQRVAQVVRVAGPGTAVTPPPARSGLSSALTTPWAPMIVVALVLGAAGATVTVVRRRR